MYLEGIEVGEAREVQSMRSRVKVRDRGVVGRLLDKGRWRHGSEGVGGSSAAEGGHEHELELEHEHRLK